MGIGPILYHRRQRQRRERERQAAAALPPLEHYERAVEAEQAAATQEPTMDLAEVANDLRATDVHSCDQCDKTFGSAQGLASHKHFKHGN